MNAKQNKEKKLMEQFKIQKENISRGIKILYVGVGGVGCEAIAHIAQKVTNKGNLLAIDTDADSLNRIDEVNNILINFDFLQEPDRENYNEIKNVLNYADIVLILAGYGGETGSVASSVIARIAKEVGALTIPIIVKPFKFEHKQRLDLADKYLRKIKDVSDSVIVIQNEKHLSSIGNNPLLQDVLKDMYYVMEEVVNTITQTIISHGDNDICLDFADLQTVMSYQGIALFGSGKSENSVSEAIEKAIEYALLDNVSLCDASGVLINFYVSNLFSIEEICDTMNIIYDNVSCNTEVIWTVTTNVLLTKGQIKTTVILTGFEK